MMLNGLREVKWTEKMAVLGDSCVGRQQADTMDRLDLALMLLDTYIKCLEPFLIEEVFHFIMFVYTYYVFCIYIHIYYLYDRC